MTRKCACITVWQADRGDEWVDVSAGRAAELSSIGMTVRIISRSSSPVRPLGTVTGIVYSGASTYVTAICDTCGYPTEVESVRKAGAQ